MQRYNAFSAVYDTAVRLQSNIQQQHQSHSEETRVRLEHVNARVDALGLSIQQTSAAARAASTAAAETRDLFVAATRTDMEIRGRNIIEATIEAARVGGHSAVFLNDYDTAVKFAKEKSDTYASAVHAKIAAFQMEIQRDASVGNHFRHAPAVSLFQEEIMVSSTKTQISRGIYAIIPRNPTAENPIFFFPYGYSVHNAMVIVRILTETYEEVCHTTAKLSLDTLSHHFPLQKPDGSSVTYWCPSYNIEVSPVRSIH